jgi:hypothetical protein
VDGRLGQEGMHPASHQTNSVKERLESDMHSGTCACIHIDIDTCARKDLVPLAAYPTDFLWCACVQACENAPAAGAAGAILVTARAAAAIVVAAWRRRRSSGGSGRRIQICALSRECWRQRWRESERWRSRKRRQLHECLTVVMLTVT